MNVIDGLRPRMVKFRSSTSVALVLTLLELAAFATVAAQTSVIEPSMSDLIDALRVPDSMFVQATSRPTAREKRRAALIEAFRRSGNQGIRALARALSDPDVALRRNAALALISIPGRYERNVEPKIDTRLAMPALIEALADSDGNVRAWAAHALAEMGVVAAPAIPALIRLLGDPYEGARNDACIALYEIGPAAVIALPALRAALQDSSADVRKFAQRAIDRIESH